MRQHLRLHPDSHSLAVASVDVEIARARADSLELSYTVTGEMSGIRMAATAANVRGERLWRHTCFEAFMRDASNAGYYELNFSPSLQWAAYHFGSYRGGMRVADEISGVPIEIRANPDGCVLRASLNPDQFTQLPRGRAWRLGLSAVIEDTEGGLSYWALAHPPGKADFHHADNFACDLAEAVKP